MNTHERIPAHGGPIDGVKLNEQPPARTEIWVVGGRYVLNPERQSYRWVEDPRSDTEES